MARLFPAKLPDYVRRDPLRAAERRVYDALSASLGDGFTVFYSRPFIGLSPEGREIEGEADFVVVHPNFGMLVLEVKGGAVGCDPDTGEWTSVDGEGRRHRIKNPVLQAQSAKHRLIEKLKEQPALARRWISAGIGVVLPASKADPELGRGAATPLELFAFADHMPELGNWVRRRLGEIAGDNGGRLGDDGVEAIIQVLAPRFQLRTPLAAVLAQDDAEFVTLTERQYFIIDFLSAHPRAAIGGAAGSGKTLIALEKARRASLEEPGRRVLLTCYNQPLAAHLRVVAQVPAGLTVASFHEICGRLASEAGVPVDRQVTHAELYDTLLPEALVEAVRRNPELAFDAIIVDEAQDFSDAWLDALQLALTDPERGGFWVFYDDNQRVYNRTPRIVRELPQPPYKLTQNVRNTRRIVDLAAPLLEPPLPRVLGPEGRVPEVLGAETAAQARSQVTAIMRRMIVDELVRPEDIAVIAPSEGQLMDVVGQKIGEWPITRAENARKGAIVADTIRRFKGLERQIVIVLESEEFPEQRELAYVALTRARLHVITIRLGAGRKGARSE